MQAILIYLLKTTIISGILFLYYYVALRNKRFHYYNRFYLLMSVALSLILPFLNIELWQFNSNNSHVINLMNVVSVNNTEIEVIGDAQLFTWSNGMLLLYIAVVTVLLITLLIGISKLYRYRRIYPAEKLGDILFINTNLQQAPFSFFNNLFWKDSLDIADATGQQIFRHELTHIEQKHSWDKLFLRLTTLAFWVNPFYWLIQKELSLIHEFIADEKAIENRSAESFALLLLQSQYGKNIFSPAQSFNYSPIKRRLFMLTTSSKTSYSYIRRILVLPLLAGTVLLFAFKLKENKQTSALTHTNAPFTLLVDAGHGGESAGVLSADGVKEKDVNLAIAKKIQSLAPEYGITVKMIRTDDVTMDPKARMDVIENVRPDAFISIHVNGTDEAQTNKHEIEVYISKDESNNNYGQSRLLGSSLMQVTKNDFPTYASLLQRKEESIYVIDHNPYPSVLVECGYMNNAENVKQLMDAAKSEQLARDILQGVVGYANAAHQTTTVNITDTSKNPPLYILDGKELTPEEFKTVDASNIEAINVLKGESAVKEYGEKGKNGAVVITLKKVTVNEAPLKVTGADSAITKALILVDGKIIPNNDVNTIDPNSIESVTVWKDADAIKKWGEKGRNGVVEIKTKKGSTPTTQNRTNGQGYVYLTTGKQDKNIESTNSNATRDTSIVSPKFPGGSDAWRAYLEKHLNVKMLKNKQAPVGTYTVMVSFTVDVDGRLSNIKSDNDPGYGTGAEAVRVIQRGPRWIPAEENGHAVAIKTKQAISFRLEE